MVLCVCKSIVCSKISYSLCICFSKYSRILPLQVFSIKGLYFLRQRRSSLIRSSMISETGKSTTVTVDPVDMEQFLLLDGRIDPDGSFVCDRVPDAGSGQGNGMIVLGGL